MARQDSVVTCTSFRCTRSLTWTWCMQFDPGWNFCDDNFPKSCDFTRAGTPPMDHEIYTEYNPWHTQIDPLSARHVSVSSRGSRTNTCSRSVVPVNGGTCAMTIFRILYLWTTKKERRCSRTVISLWKKRACEVEGTQGALIDMSPVNSRAVSPANGGTRATMKVHSRLSEILWCVH